MLLAKYSSRILVASVLVMPLVAYCRWLAANHKRPVEHGSIATERNRQRDTNSYTRVCWAAILIWLTDNAYCSVWQVADKRP